MRRCSLLALLLLLAISCTDEFGKSDVGGTAIDRTFEASIEAPTDSADTRTLLGGQTGDSNRSVLWQYGDEVYVTTGSTSAKFSNTGSRTSSMKAVLEGKIADASTYYAFYPYSMVSGYASGKFNVSLPASQRYYAGGIESGSFPMVAQYSNGVFNFRNLCGILVLNLVGDAEVTSITFSGKDSSGNSIKVAGAVTVSTSYSSAPTLAMSSTAGTSVTLDCTNQYTGRGVTLSQSTATPFHIVLPAGTYSSFNLSISTQAGKQMEVNSTKALTINRSQRTTTSKLTYKEAQESQYEYVDLGLSVKWATCNVGASKPEEYGDYFAWGETEPYYQPGYAQEDPQTHWKSGKSSGYGWSSYKYCKGGYDTMTKYCNKSSYGYNGFTDSKTVLDPEDDAAHVNWGGDWRMPTKDEFDELLNSSNCTWTWTTMNGVKGYKVVSKKSGYAGNYIFLPAAGYRYGTYLHSVGSYGNFWSSSLYTGYPDSAYYLDFHSGYCNSGIGTRDNGQSVRPVCQSDDYVPVSGVTLNYKTLSLNVGENSQLTATVTPSNVTFKAVSWASSDPTVATVDYLGNVTAVSAGTATITAISSDDSHSASCTVTVSPKYEYVDLGLSVKWATCNVGADSPEEYGDYFGWGETEPYYEPGYAQENPQSHWKSDKSNGYEWSSYKYCDGSSQTMTKYCQNSSRGKNGYTDSKTVLDPEDDAAQVNWGGSWRMPTKAEQDELRNTSNCSWTWTTINGINGYKVQSKKPGYTDRWIFLPAAGCRMGMNLNLVGSFGCYWSSSFPAPSDSINARELEFDSSYYGYVAAFRIYGLSVRPVCP